MNRYAWVQLVLLLINQRIKRLGLSNLKRETP